MVGSLALLLLMPQAAQAQSGSAGQQRAAAPTAAADAYTLNEDQPLTVSAPGVLGNDTGATSARLVNGPANGSMQLNDDGSFTYSPGLNFNGTDQVSYVAEAEDPTAEAFTIDQGASSVTIDVSLDTSLGSDRKSASSPVAGTLTAQVTPNNGPFTAFHLTDLNVQLVDALSMTFQLGIVNVTVTAAAGALGVTLQQAGAPAAVSAGAFTQTNNVLRTAGTVTLAGVPGLPEGPQPVDEVQTLNLSGQIAEQGGILQLVMPLSFTGTFGEPGNTGTLTLTGTIVATAPKRLAETSSPAAVVFTINPVNDAPVFTSNPVPVASPGELYTYAVSAGDIDGDPVALTLQQGPAFLSLTPNGNGTATLSGTPTEADAGAHEVVLQASDGLTALNGGPAKGGSLLETTQRFTLAVTTAPVALGESYALAEDQALAVSVANGVLANDTDAAGSPLSAVLVTPPANGSLVLSADGSFTYTPTPDFFGSDAFVYQADNGTNTSGPATVDLAIAPVNDAPVFTTSPSIQGAPGQPYTYGVGATDVDGDPLSFSFSGPAWLTLTDNGDGTAVLSGTPSSAQAGVHPVVVRVNDGAATVEQSFQLTINQAPVAGADQYRGAEDQTLTVTAAEGVLANDMDPDGDPLTALLQATTTRGTLTFQADGSFSYTPPANFSGNDTFTYQASDGINTSPPVVVTLIINSANDTPTITSTPPTEAMVAIPYAYPITATDPESDPLTITMQAGPAWLMVIQQSPVTATLEGTPGYADVGLHEVTVRASDGALFNEQTFQIEVRAAVLALDEGYQTEEDAALVVAAAAGVLANDADADGDPLTAILVDNPAHGTLTLEPDGAFTYQPDADFSGPDIFTYQASDGANTSNVATVTITVIAANDAPSAAAITTPANGATFLLTEENEADAFVVDWTEANDPDGDVVTYTWQLSTTETFTAPAAKRLKEVLISQDTGTETELETTFGALDALLEAEGVEPGQNLTLYHRVLSRDGIDTTASAVFAVNLERAVVVDTEDGAELPAAFAVDQNYPNPFNPETVIAYALPKAAEVVVRVYDAGGREVATLREGTKAAGRYEARFDGRGLPSGVYLFRLDAGAYQAVRTMTLVK